MMIRVEIDGQTYEVNIENIQARPVIAMVDGEQFEVWPEEHERNEVPMVSAPTITIPETSQPTPVVGGGGNQSAGGKNVTAPLPGVIVAILVKPGESISRGDELCTLEAMKMKNAIRSNRAGTIASVEVNVGDQVGHGQVLMTYTE